MPIIQQILLRTLASAPAHVVRGSVIGAAEHAMGGGSMAASMEAARASGALAVEGIRADAPGFACGALRGAMENTPVFGPVFRLGQAALGRRMCASEEMTNSERQSLARGAAVDMVAPGASFALDVVEFATAKQAGPVLPAPQPLEAASEPDTSAPIASGNAPAPQPALFMLDSDAAEPSLPAPAFASQGSIASKLAARRPAPAPIDPTASPFYISNLAPSEL